MITFKLGRSGETVEAWSKPPQFLPVFFEQELPALFERMLALEKCELGYDARLKWLFTGDLGAFAVSVSPQSISFRQWYHDSFAHNASDPVDWPFWDRLGETANRVWKEDFRKLDRLPKEIRIVVDHHFDVSVFTDGALLWRQHISFDVRHHQLQLAPDGDVQGRLLMPEAKPVSVTVQPQKTHQKMIGFGGTGIPTAYQLLSDEGKRRWWEIVTEFNLLIQRENPIGRRLKPDCSNWDSLADASPHYYADNFPNGEICNFAYNKAFFELGGDVWFEFWEFPKWVQRGEIKQGGARSDEIDAAQYARAMVEYCRASKAKAGRAPGIVGVQNEICQNEENLRQMVPALRRGLDEAGFKDTKIHMSNAPSLWWLNEVFVKRYRDAGVWDTVNFAATNLYDSQEHFKDIDRYDPIVKCAAATAAGKDLLVTECCVIFRAFQINSYKAAFAMAQVYHKLLTMADARAILYCWTLVNVVQPSFGWTRTLFTIDERNNRVPVPGSFQARVYGAFSKFVRAGMKRMEVSSNNPDLLATAFVSDKGDGTLILINRSTAPMDVTTGKLPFPVKNRLDTGHAHNNVLRAVTGSESVRIEPGALVTLSSLELQRLPAGFNVPGC